MNPDELFTNIIKILHEALKGKQKSHNYIKLTTIIADANVTAENVLCLGLSVQRSTFIVVDKFTGEPFHQLISWSDRRANEMVEQMNKSLLMKIINGGAKFLYFFTHKNRYKQGSNLKLKNNWVRKINYVISTSKLSVK